MAELSLRILCTRHSCRAAVANLRDMQKLLREHSGVERINILADGLPPLPAKKRPMELRNLNAIDDFPKQYVALNPQRLQRPLVIRDCAWLA